MSATEKDLIESSLSAQELRNEVRNLAFAIWEQRVQKGGSCFGDARSDWFTARKELGIPQDLVL